jgi:hypothetical protein
MFVVSNALLLKAKITLLEALVGVEFKLKGLDGKEIVVSHPDVIRPGALDTIPNEVKHNSSSVPIVP